jgi:hypothetical protein
MTNRFNLPEKDYFTRDELAKRWQCGIDLVDYYVDHFLIREAFSIYQQISFDIFLQVYLKCDATSEAFNKYFSHVHDLMQFSNASEIFEISDENTTILTEFAYAEPRAFVTDLERGPITSEQTKHGHDQGKRTRLTFLCGFHNECYIPIERSGKGARDDPHTWQFASINVNQAMRESMIIPREERDRFENHVSTESTNAAHQETHSSFPEISNTIATGYLITIGLLARSLADVDNRYLKSDGSINAKAMAELLEKSSVGLSGHGTEALRKRIAAGISKLKEIS